MKIASEARSYRRYLEEASELRVEDLVGNADRRAVSDVGRITRHFAERGFVRELDLLTVALLERHRGRVAGHHGCPQEDRGIARRHRRHLGYSAGRQWRGGSARGAPRL